MNLHWVLNDRKLVEIVKKGKKKRKKKTNNKITNDMLAMISRVEA